MSPLARKVWISVLGLQLAWSCTTLAVPSYFWKALLEHEDDLSTGSKLLIQWLQIQAAAANLCGLVSAIVRPFKIITAPFYMAHLFLALTYGIILQDVWFMFAEIVLIIVCLWVELANIVNHDQQEPDREFYVQGWSHKMLEIWLVIQLILLVVSTAMLRDFMHRLELKWESLINIVLFILLWIYTVMLQVLNLLSVYVIKQFDFTLMTAAFNGLAAFGLVFVYGVTLNLPQSYTIVDAFVGCQFAAGLGFIAAICIDLFTRG